MQAIVKPSVLSGTIQAPVSKSSMQRACAAALVRGGISIIRNPGRSNDDKAAVGILQALGCEIRDGGDQLSIDSGQSVLKAKVGTQKGAISVNCGESGLGVRMFTPILAMSDREITIHGEGSLLNRPVDFFDAILPQLGVRINSNSGRLPLRIRGPLHPANILVDGSLSSQFLTGLLFA